MQHFIALQHCLKSASPTHLADHLHRVLPASMSADERGCVVLPQALHVEQEWQGGGRGISAVVVDEGGESWDHGTERGGARAVGAVADLSRWAISVIGATWHEDGRGGKLIAAVCKVSSRVRNGKPLIVN